MRALILTLSASLAFVLGCRYDPVPQHIINDLGPEEGTPSALHRPGQPCVVCHGAYGGASPPLAVAGTLFSVQDGALTPASGILVTIVDSAGQTRKACSNKAGNFSVALDNWADAAYPLNPVAGGITMVSLIGRDGSCASCHKLPPKEDPDGVYDPTTGAGFDSAGVILVDPTATDPTCGGGS